MNRTKILKQNKKYTKLMEFILYWPITSKTWLMLHWRKLVSLSQYLLDIDSWLGLGPCFYFPFSILGFSLICICVGLVCAVPVSIISYLYLSSSVWKALFPWSHLPSLALEIFLPLLLNKSLNHEGNGVIKMSHLGLSAKKTSE